MSDTDASAAPPRRGPGRPRKPVVEPTLAEQLMPSLRNLITTARAIGYNSAIGRLRREHERHEDEALNNVIRTVQEILRARHGQ